MRPTCLPSPDSVSHKLTAHLSPHPGCSPVAHLPLKDPPQPQAWASDRAPGFVLPAGGALQSSQGAGHGSHGSWPRPHKHRGLPGPGQPGANPGVFTKDGDPSWNLRPPPSLSHSAVCFTNYQAQHVCGSGRDHSQPCASHEPGRHSLCSQQSGHLWNSCPRPAPRQRRGCKANPHQQPCSCRRCAGHHSHLPHNLARAPQRHATW